MTRATNTTCIATYGSAEITSHSDTVCDDCGRSPAERDGAVSICATCKDEIRNSLSLLGGNETAAVFPPAPLLSAVAVSTNSESPVGDRQAVVASKLLDKPDVTAADGIPSFLLRSHPDCVIKNSTTLRVTHDSLIQASPASSDISSSLVKVS